MCLLDLFGWSVDRKGKAHITTGLLAYSRGQLAVKPCTECEKNYGPAGSVLPFPNCVFLPHYWYFACACCLARGKGGRCSFNTHRKPRLNGWLNVYEPNSIWLKTAHKQPPANGIIWLRHVRDLEHPQEPYLPRAPTLRLLPPPAAMVAAAEPATPQSAAGAREVISEAVTQYVLEIDLTDDSVENCGLCRKVISRGAEFEPRFLLEGYHHVR